MSVTQIKQALGTWSITLDASTPREILDAITPFGHIAMVPGRVNVTAAGDNLLKAARYVGVYRTRSAAGDITLSGAGNEFWLGDEDDKGPVALAPVVSASATFANAIRQFIPAASVTEGALFSIPGGGLWTNTAQYETARTSLSYITDSYSTPTVPVSWRINPDWTLDAGRDVDLFVTVPTAILVAKNGGRDLSVVGLKGTLELDTDVEDYTTKVVLLAEGDGASTVSASASLISPYLGPKGLPVAITRLVSEFETDTANAQARAQLQLNRFTNPRQAVSLSTDEYDVKGKFSVGDSIMVFDPAQGFVDLNREVFWRGQPINPAVFPVTEMTWPVPDQWTVAFRDGAGNWFDLSKYYKPEGGATTVVVGGFSRTITNANAQPVGSRPIGDSSIPATPVFGTPYTSAYQSGTGGPGTTRAQVQLNWTRPLNLDGSTILDGDHYEIRFRPNVTVPYPATWNDASAYTWNAVLAASGAWQQPLVPPLGLATGWKTELAGWDVTTINVNELTPRVTYEFQIRAVDSASPPNASPWSSSLAVSAAPDNLPPAQPAAPEVAGSNVSIQVTHRLGVAAGGTFNLDADLDYLEIHVGGSTSFFPDATTLVGKLSAGPNLVSGVPVVGTFPIQALGQVNVKVVAVDRTGNRSPGSPAAQVTALLIADAYISDLTVSKVTAGTITASWIMAGSIKTAVAGARSEMDALGIRLYDATGTVTLNASAVDGSLSMIGTLTTGKSGTAKRIQLNPMGAQGEIRFYNTDGSDYALISTESAVGGTESSIRIRSSIDGSNHYYGQFMSTTKWYAGYLDNSTNVASGGLFIADAVEAIVAFSPNSRTSSGAQASQGLLTLGAYDPADSTITKSGMQFQDDGQIFITGAYLNNNTFAPAATDAVVQGSRTYNANGVAVAYGTTMASTPWAMCTLGTTGSPGADINAWQINVGPTTTGFSVNQDVSAQTRITYWCARYTS